MTAELTDALLLSHLRAALVGAGVPEAAAAALDVSTSLSDDLGVDSFQLTEVARALEHDFGDRLVLLDWILEEEADAPDDAAPAYRVDRLFAFMRRALAS